MELRLLTTFLKVAQLQSFSKAAESLGYSQSAVTVQVQQLENELGVRLFDRIGKTVSITHYGQEFIPYARDVVSAAARAVSFTVEERDLTGTLRIGTIESIMTASFGEILPLYHEHCPRVNTQLIEGDTKTLSDMLMHNEVDLIYTLDDMGYDARKMAASRSCRSRTATWSSGASWCTTATRCSRRRSALWSPALRRWKKSRCISRAEQGITKTCPHRAMGAGLHPGTKTQSVTYGRRAI